MVRVCSASACVLVEEGKTVYLHELIEGSDLFFCGPPKPERVSEWHDHNVCGCASSAFCVVILRLSLVPWHCTVEAEGCMMSCSIEH